MNELEDYLSSPKYKLKEELEALERTMKTNEEQKRLDRQLDEELKKLKKTHAWELAEMILLFEKKYGLDVRPFWNTDHTLEEYRDMFKKLEWAKRNKGKPITERARKILKKCVECGGYKRDSK